VAHDTPLELHLPGGHLPQLCRRGRKPGSCLCRHEAVANPESLGRVGAARQLKDAAHIGVSIHVSGRSATVGGVDHLDRLEVGIEFLGDDRRQPRVNALSHLDLARVRDERPVVPEPDVRKYRVARVLRREAARLQFGSSD
jgi:hypothetical protein